MIFVYILKHLASRGVGVKTVEAGRKGLSINNFEFIYKVLLSSSVLNKDLIAITNYIWARIILANIYWSRLEKAFIIYIRSLVRGDELVVLIFCGLFSSNNNGWLSLYN
jgi:hypothetical protein